MSDVRGEGQGWRLYSELNGSWVLVTWEPPCEQTDTSENTVFPQLRWPSGKITRGIDKGILNVM